MSERLWAIRGAAQADANDEESILAATRELVSELMERNELEPESFVSVIFTVHRRPRTRSSPRSPRASSDSGEVPLLCNREMEVPGAMERVIRLLAHYHAPADHTPAARLSGRDEEAPRRPPLSAMTIRFSKRLDEIPGLQGGRARGQGARGDRRRGHRAARLERVAVGPAPRRRRGDRARRRRDEPLPGPGRDAASPPHRRAPRRRPRRDRRLERKLRAPARRGAGALRGRRRGPLRVAVVLDLPLHGAALGRARDPRPAERRLRARPRRDARGDHRRDPDRRRLQPEQPDLHAHPDRPDRRVRRRGARSRLRDPRRGLRRVPAPRRPRGVGRPLAPIGEPRRPSDLLQVLRPRRPARWATRSPRRSSARPSTRCASRSA